VPGVPPPAGGEGAIREVYVAESGFVTDLDRLVPDQIEVFYGFMIRMMPTFRK
jgi:hypothetical protein